MISGGALSSSQQGDFFRSETTKKYFDELLVEMRHMNRMRTVQPDSFTHAATLLTTEIQRVWAERFGGDGGDVGDPKQSEENAMVRLEEKIPIPDYPEGKDKDGHKCNLVGRILGPNGISVRQLEAETDCAIRIRGWGSIKDRQRQARLRGIPGWEHLKEPLHVVITAQARERAACEKKLGTAIKMVNKLLQPGDDEYKKNQLIQLAIMKGTYRTTAPPSPPPVPIE